MHLLLCSHDYHKSQAKVLWWYSEPLEIWQIHSLAPSQHLSSMLLFPGGKVWITLLLPLKAEVSTPGVIEEKMIEKDGSTWLTFKCYSWSIDYDYEKSQARVVLLHWQVTKVKKEQLWRLFWWKSQNICTQGATVCTYVTDFWIRAESSLL